MKRFPAFSAFFINAVTAKRFCGKTRSVEHAALLPFGARRCAKLIRLSEAGVAPPGAFGCGKSERISYLVDSASSHMLVSKIKPCMSKYTQIIL